MQQFTLESTIESVGKVKNTVSLFTELLNDACVASVSPSSKYIVKVISDNIDYNEANIIVELGAGTGIITKELLGKMKKQSTLVAIESNPSLAEMLSDTILSHNLQVVHDDAFNLAKICESLRVKPDVIVCGIPLSFFPEEKVSQLFNQMRTLMACEGNLIIYQTWLPPFVTGFRTQKLLKTSFQQVSSKEVYINLPPLKIIKACPILNQ